MSTTTLIVIVAGFLLVCIVGYRLYRRSVNRANYPDEIYPLF